MLCWQYRKIDLNDLPPTADEIDLINKVGDQGWELVAITTNHIAYFKHKIEHRMLPEHATKVKLRPRSSRPGFYPTIPDEDCPWSRRASSAQYARGWQCRWRSSPRA